MSEEIDFEQARPVKLIVDVSPEKTVAFFKGEEENPLQLSDVDEAWMKEFSELLQELDHLSKLVEMKKLDLKRIAKGEETLQRGKFVALFKTIKGRRTVRWEDYVKSQIKNIPEAELAPYIKEGEPSVRFDGIKELK
jgi:hypothetical protein